MPPCIQLIVVALLKRVQIKRPWLGFMLKFRAIFRPEYP